MFWWWLFSFARVNVNSDGTFLSLYLLCVFGVNKSLEVEEFLERLTTSEEVCVKITLVKICVEIKINTIWFDLYFFVGTKKFYDLVRCEHLKGWVIRIKLCLISFDLDFYCNFILFFPKKSSKIIILYRFSLLTEANVFRKAKASLGQRWVNIRHILWVRTTFIEFFIFFTKPFVWCF